MEKRRPSDPSDYWTIYSDLFTGPDSKDFAEGKIREELLKKNASVFVFTRAPENIDALREKIVSDACSIADSINGSNESVFTERLKLKSIIHILSALCEKYRMDLENSIRPAHSIFERLARIENGLRKHNELLINFSDQHSGQLQYLIEQVDGVPEEAEEAEEAGEDLSLLNISSVSNRSTQN